MTRTLDYLNPYSTRWQGCNLLQNLVRVNMFTCTIVPITLREPQHTPGAYPRHPQTPKWKDFLHKLLVGGLGYAPGVCWKVLRITLVLQSEACRLKRVVCISLLRTNCSAIEMLEHAVDAQRGNALLLIYKLFCWGLWFQLQVIGRTWSPNRQYIHLKFTWNLNMMMLKSQLLLSLKRKMPFHHKKTCQKCFPAKLPWKKTYQQNNHRREIEVKVFLCLGWSDGEV